MDSYYLPLRTILNLRTPSIKAVLLATCLSGASVYTASAQAADTDTDTDRVKRIEPVIVTAQKRAEVAQDVPQSIQTFSAPDLEKIGFSEMSDVIDKIPSLTSTANNYSSQGLLLFMRGVQTLGSVDSGVGVYIDDMYVSRNTGATMTMADIERIEVLPGPQGTLYGRNTIGGAVKFVTAKPTGEWGFKQSLDFGNYNAFRSASHLNLPEFNGLSIKLSAVRDLRDGWVENSGAGRDYFEKDNGAYRIAARWRPVDALTVDYSFDYTDVDATPNYQQRQFETGFFPYNFPLFEDRQDSTYRPVDLGIHESSIQRRHLLTAAWDITDNLTLKSVTGALSQDRSWLNDSVESFNVPALQGGTSSDESFQQEFLLSGQTDNGDLKYHLGVFYFDESGDVLNYQLGNNAYVLAGAVPFVPPTLDDLIPPSTTMYDFQSQAVYGQVSWTPSILDRRMQIDLGGRYSEDDRRQNGSTAPGVPLEEGRQSYDSFDPSLTIDYRFTDDVHAYARYATAYRAGGFNLADFVLGTTEFGPESLTSYEIGIKSLFADDKVLLNANAFWTEYEDIQFSAYVSVGVGVAPRLQTINGGTGEINGVEGEFRVLPFEGLSIGGNLTYLEASAELRNPDTGVVSEQPLAATPKWSYTANAEYVFPPFDFGELAVNVSYDFTDEKTSPTLVSTIHPECRSWDARATLSDMEVNGGDLRVALWSKNFTDEECQIYHAFDSVSFSTPRTYGLSLTMEF